MGFGVAGGGAEKQRKLRMLGLIAHLRTVPGLLETLCAIRGLPAPRYDETQWELLRHIFTALLYAMGELKVVFAERNEVDFVELGLAADTVLRASRSALARRAQRPGAGIQRSCAAPADR